MSPLKLAGAPFALAIAAAAALTPSVTRAEPNDYVASPIVEEGEREIELKSGVVKLRDGSRESRHSLAFGYGINSWWATEVYASWHKEPGERLSFDSWELENRFQLTETGRYPVDVGLLIEVERPRDRAEGYEFRYGALMQSDLSDQWQGNLNLLFERRIKSTDGNGPIELGYQWQLKYRWHPELEFGVQGLGDVGHWRHWEPRDEQPHSVGPVVLGRFKTGQHQFMKYDVGLLFGLTDGAPHRTLRARAEFEF
jgi:hypothetical protein